MVKHLRKTVTALGVMGCVLLIGLWVRSYQWRDALCGFISVDRAFTLSSMNGDYALIVETAGAGDEWELATHKLNEGPVLFCGVMIPPNFLGIGGMSLRDGYYVVMPHWFVVLIFALTAAVPWIHCSKRFSLRTLLIATTLVALVLGIIYVAGQTH